MTMITPSYLGETIEYSSLHACRSTLEDPTPVVLPILTKKCVIVLRQTCCVRDKRGIMMRKPEFEAGNSGCEYLRGAREIATEFPHLSDQIF